MQFACALYLTLICTHTLPTYVAHKPRGRLGWRYEVVSIYLSTIDRHIDRQMLFVLWRKIQNLLEKRLWIILLLQLTKTTCISTINLVCLGTATYQYVSFHE